MSTNNNLQKKLKIEVKNLSIAYHDKLNDRTIEAIQGIDLEIYNNDFLVIIGPSGCGKSSLLSAIAGVVNSTSGEVLIDGKSVSNPKNVALMFQDSLLLPWRTVEKNIEFGLEPRNITNQERRERVKKYLKLVNLEEFRDAYPSQLSGGMSQRVALCRALAMETDILLMDEPFGGLDEQTRLLLADELIKIWRNVKRTVVFVTHSLSEAVYLGERIAIMTKRPGRLKDVLAVNINRPRDFDSPHFSQLQQTIWEKLREEAPVMS